MPTRDQVLDELSNLAATGTDFVIAGDAAAAIHGAPYPVRTVEVVVGEDPGWPGVADPAQALAVVVDATRYQRVRRNAAPAELASDVEWPVASLRDVVRELMDTRDESSQIRLPALLRLLEMSPDHGAAVTTTDSDNRKTTSPTQLHPDCG